MSFWEHQGTFTSFVEAGLEDAYSRIRLGVHYRMDCDEGVNWATWLQPGSSVYPGGNKEKVIRFVLI